MPGATTARLVFCAAAMPAKLRMMPHTVPKRPMNGAAEPNVARNGEEEQQDALDDNVGVQKQRDDRKSRCRFHNPIPVASAKGPQPLLRDCGIARVRRLTGSESLRQSGKDGPPRPELRRTDADP